MSENDWNKVLEDEDRIIDNSDRKHRYHFNSLEAMSEELVYQESMTAYREHDPVELSPDDSFIGRINDKRLANALRRLTKKQLQVLELRFWEGYTQDEVADKLNCKQAAVSRLLARALQELERQLM